MLTYDEIQLGTILKNRTTEQLVSVCQIYENQIYWDSESPCIGFESWHIESLEELQEWEILQNYVRLPHGRVFEADEHNNVSLGKRQLQEACNRSIVSAYLEQVFMQDGWEEIFELEDDFVWGLTDGEINLLDFIDSVNHFVNDGCPHMLLGLVKDE